MAEGRRRGPIGVHDGHGEPTYRFGTSGFPRAGVTAPGPLGSVSRSHRWHPPAISAVRGRPRRRSLGPVATTAPIAQPVPVVATATSELNYENVYEDLKPWEGMVTWMYLDTAKPPKVTVGVGNMLPDVASAQALPFVNASTNQPATKEEIAAAFNKVAAMKGSMASDKYKVHPSIEISEVQAKAWALKRLEHEFVPNLRKAFKGFDKFPLPAKEALIDMIYNMGIGWTKHTNKKGEVVKARGLMSYLNLVAAVKAEDWQKASLHCWRKPSNTAHPQHAEARNAWTKKRFEDADRIAHPKQPGAADGPHP